MTGDDHEGQHLARVHVMRQELDQFLPAVGLIEKGCVNGVEGDDHDVAWFRPVDGQIAELSLGRWRRRKNSTVSGQFLEVGGGPRPTVLKKAEVFLTETVDVPAGLISHHNRYLDEDRFRAKLNLGFI